VGPIVGSSVGITVDVRDGNSVGIGVFEIRTCVDVGPRVGVLLGKFGELIRSGSLIDSLGSEQAVRQRRMRQNRIK